MSEGIAATLHIRRNDDGTTRSLSLKAFGGYHGDFIWSEGNFSCDCNRGQFFAEAAGEDDPDEECGHERYSVRIVADADGRQLYADDDHPAD